MSDVQEIDDFEGSGKTQHNSKVIEKRIKKLTEGVEFLGNFDPEKSSREQRKLSRKCYAQGTKNAAKGSLYDDKGRYRSNGLDACDCLNNTCDGCHFPCNNCESTKCGTVCRVNRRWAFDGIEHDGKDLVLSNKNLETEK